MSDPVAELNQLLYTATPAERRAIVQAALPLFARWLVDTVDSCACADADDPETVRWPLQVSTELLVPLGAAVHRAQSTSGRVPRPGCQAPTTTS